MSAAPLALAIDDLDADLAVIDAVIEERACRPITARVRAVASAEGAPVAIGPLDVIGRAAQLTMHLHGVERRVALVVEEARDLDAHAELTLASPLARLAGTSGYRVFVSSSATEIVARVLAARGMRIELRAARTPDKRDHVAQVFESDLDFCERILAEEGMSFFPSPDDPPTIRVCDAPETFPDSGLAIPFREEAGLEAGRGLYAARVRRRLTSESLGHRDDDPERPMLELRGEAGAGALAVHEYPGGFATPEVGRALAEARLAALQAEATVLEAEATEPALTAGQVFTIISVPEGLSEARWLVIAVTHEARTREADGAPLYRARLRAVPARQGYRPPRSRRPPGEARGGVSTAVVAGAPGQEIALDALGRARVRLRWDRAESPFAEASAYARVTQSQMAGALASPRVGWEQLVGWSDRGGEVPLLLGRVYNAVQAPPASLPGKKVETHLGTRTTPRGSSGNALRISDAAGDEILALVASGDYAEQTENDKRAAVATRDERAIGGDRALIVSEHLLEKITGDIVSSIGGSREVRVASNLAIEAGADRAFIGAARSLRAGGDYLTRAPHVVRIVGGVKQEIGIEHQSVFATQASSLFVGASMTTEGGPSESVGAAGLAMIKVAGLKSITTGHYALSVRGAYVERFASKHASSGGDIGEGYAKAAYEVKGAAAVTAAEVVVQATERLTIKAGGVTITMTPGSIEVNGEYEGATPSVEEGFHRYG
jgi:type VI secretion system secreted protein VgrG